MLLPKSVVRARLEPGTVLYFVSDQLKNTAEPHYLICLRADEDESGSLWMAVCTTKLDTILKFATRRDLPMSTIIELRPSSINGLRKVCYVNCNSPIEHTHADIYRHYERGQLAIRGKLSADELQQIIDGIVDSPMISQEFKDNLLQ